MLSMICAVGQNNEIGYKNKLLWHLPNDLKYFQKITQGHTVIMGKTTFESIGFALPNRHNIVLAKEKDYIAKNCEICNNLKGLVDKYTNSNEEIFVIGGASIYKQFLPYANKLYLTLVNDSPRADTFFPDYDDFKEENVGDEKKENSIKYRFAIFTKR
jgi:dihydrofolate reductase